MIFELRNPSLVRFRTSDRFANTEDAAKARKAAPARRNKASRSERRPRRGVRAESVKQKMNSLVLFLDRERERESHAASSVALENVTFGSCSPTTKQADRLELWVQHRDS